MTLNKQTFIHINTNDNSPPLRTTESKYVSVSFIRTVHYDSLKAHITKYMTQGSCMLEPPMVSYVE